MISKGMFKAAWDIQQRKIDDLKGKIASDERASDVINFLTALSKPIEDSSSGGDAAKPGQP